MANNKFTILQFNMLANGLAFDGFICSNKLETKDGKTESIKDFLNKINKESFKNFADNYDTEFNRKITNECLSWDLRWERILSIVNKYSPDIMVFQEMDCYSLALKEFGKLGYSSSLNNSANYKSLAYDNNANSETYLEKLNESGFAFLPKLFSKCFELLNKRNKRIKSASDAKIKPDNDGCAIFWKTNKYDINSIHYCQFNEYNSEKKDSDGALAVILYDKSLSKKLCVITSHFPSGHQMERKLERLEIISKNYPFHNFYNKLKNICSNIIFSFDANSDPTEIINNESLWKSFHQLYDFKSVWDDYFDLNGMTKKNIRPITVNKIRGPESNQLHKIGLHAYELIDHIYFQNLKFDKFNTEIIHFENKDDSLLNLIPNKEIPSDHYPIVVTFEFIYH